MGQCPAEIKAPGGSQTRPCYGPHAVLPLTEGTRKPEMKGSQSVCQSTSQGIGRPSSQEGLTQDE